MAVQLHDEQKTAKRALPLALLKVGARQGPAHVVSRTLDGDQTRHRQTLSTTTTGRLYGVVIVARTFVVKDELSKLMKERLERRIFDYVSIPSVEARVDSVA